MKTCSFCDPLRHTPHRFLHFDTTHLYVHCSNTHLMHIRYQSNTDISTALHHLGILFTHSPYPHTLGYDLFRTFLSHLLHQYDHNTHLYLDTTDRDIDPHPYHQYTVAPHTHHYITTCLTTWKQFRPALTPVCSDYLAYPHGLVSSLPPTNYSRASINFIDYTYIGVLPRFTHTIIQQYFSAFAQQ